MDPTLDSYMTEAKNDYNLLIARGEEYDNEWSLLCAQAASGSRVP